jgi:hypothetical protein
MKKLKKIGLILVAIASSGLAYKQTNAKAKRVLPFTYYALRTGSSWVWVTSKPGPPYSCLVFPGTSCTVTTTISPATIAIYNGTYLPGRSKNPVSPTNMVYQ